MFLRSSRRWRDVAPKTPGHIRFPSCRFLQMYYSIVPGVSEVTFLAKKERRNTGGINSPVRANWMGQEVPPRCGYMKIFLHFVFYQPYAATRRSIYLFEITLIEFSILYFVGWRTIHLLTQFQLQLSISTSPSHFDIRYSLFNRKSPSGDGC